MDKVPTGSIGGSFRLSNIRGKLLFELGLQPGRGLVEGFRILGLRRGNLLLSELRCQRGYWRSWYLG